MKKGKPKVVKPPIGLKPKPASKASTAITVNPSKWIRTEKKWLLPDYVREAITLLSDKGYVCYLVGGCVRDFLLGRTLKDYDLVTDALPDEVEKLFPRAIGVGKAFGVMKVPVVSLKSSGSNANAQELLEIATFREDLEYKDFRHPTRVRFAGPVEDALRRDFTINALYYDPKTSRILDSVGGIEDLKLKVIRAIGNPDERFQEDALRLLRAIRFATHLSFKLDDATLKSLCQRSRLITYVSAERIRDELTALWKGPRPHDALELLLLTGLLKGVIPELSLVKETTLTKKKDATASELNPWVSTLKSLKALAELEAYRSVALSWACVLQSVGRPIAYRKNQGANFNGHEIDGARLAMQISDRLRLPRTDIDRIGRLIEDQLKCKEVFQMREATLQRFLRETHIPELLCLHRAQIHAQDGNLAFYEFCQSRRKELDEMPEIEIPVSGDDLIQMGFEPGPKFAEILRQLEDLCLENKLKTKEEAMDYILTHFVR